MSVTYPADATATTYLFTLRGKVNTPTVAYARELHNKTAGSADGIAAARALGDLSHNVYTSAGCDLYVLILGHRYGFQPPQDNPEGLSITHLEFRRAGECSIPRITLVRTSIPDVGLSDLADPERLALVSAFRAEVAREVRAAEFSDPQGLVQGLSTGVLAALGKRPEGPPAGGAGAAAAAPGAVPGRAGGTADRAR
jgi:hypothetical protein